MSAADNKLTALGDALVEFTTAQRNLVNAAIHVADELRRANLHTESLEAALHPFAGFYAQQLERQGPTFAESASALLLSRPAANLLNVQHLRAAHDALKPKA